MSVDRFTNFREKYKTDKQVVIVLSGISGSGKSTLAKQLAELEPATAVISADDFFMEEGFYRFNPKKLGDAHAQCLRDFTEYLLQGGMHLIVVDNTNTTNWERAPYMALGMAYGYATWLVLVEEDAATAYARNVHAVPRAAIEGMLARMEEEEPPRNWQCQTLLDGMTAKDLLTTIKAV